MDILNFENNINLVHKNVREIGWHEKFTELGEKLIKAKMNEEVLVGGMIVKTLQDIQKRENTFFYFNFDVFYNITNRENIILTQLDNRRYLNIQKDDFRKKEEIRLLEYYEKNSKNEHEILPPFFFLYSDFVSQSIVGGQYVNLLKILPFMKNNTSKMFGGLFTPTRTEFVSVNKKILKNLEFKLCTNSGKEYQFFNKDEDELCLTLLFRKKK